MLINNHNNKAPSVLAFFPTSANVGYAYYLPDKTYHNSGKITSRKRDNKSFYTRMVQMIKDFEPMVIVLEEYRVRKNGTKTGRRKELIKMIEGYCKRNGIHLSFQSPVKVKTVFSFYGANTHYEMIQLIKEWMPNLNSLEIAKRDLLYKDYQQYWSNMFSAITLAITFFYLGHY